VILGIKKEPLIPRDQSQI